MYSDIARRMEKLSRSSKVPCTIHILINNEAKVACGKRANGEHVENIELASERIRKSIEEHATRGVMMTKEQLRGYYYGYGETALSMWLVRMKFFQHAGGVKVTLCATCKRRAQERISDDAAQELKAEKTTSTTIVPIAQDEFRDRGGRDGMLPPQRPVGTEGMTGHLDDGSKAGVCETSAAGFRTTYLPWIQCGHCLVQYDQFVEEGLMYTRGLYAEAVR